MDNRGLFGYEGEGFLRGAEPDPDDIDTPGARGRDNFGAEPYGEPDRPRDTKNEDDGDGSCPPAQIPRLRSE